MADIRIQALPCGTMRVKASQACLDDRRPGERRITLPVNAWLIRHPVHGNILVDTGWSADVRDLLPRRLLNFYEPEISPEQTAAARLRALGLEPEDIDLVLLTHLDVDHTCALKDFAGKAKRIVCSELEYFYSCRMVYKRREVWDTWIPYADRIERVHYRASVLGPVKRGFDLFGDDSILCIYCPGHTDGLFTVLVNQAPSSRFNAVGDGLYGGAFAVLASDAAFSQRNIDTLSVPGYGFDRHLQAESLRFLQRLKADPNCRGILCSHSAEGTETELVF